MDKELDSLLRIKNKTIINGNLSKAAKICFDIACIYSSKERYEEAISELNDARQFCSRSDINFEADILRNLGENLFENGEHRKALEIHSRFLELARQIEDNVKIQRALTTLGRTRYEVYCSLESDAIEKDKLLLQAEDSYLEAVETTKKLTRLLPASEIVEMKTGLLINLGLVYEKMERISDCGDCLKKALYLSKQNNLIDDLHRCQFSLSLIYQTQGMNELGLQLIDDAIESARKLDKKGLLSDAHYVKATLSLEIEDYDAAKDNARLAFRLSSKMKKSDRKAFCQAVYIVHESNEKLLQYSSTKIEEKMIILEKLADAFAHLRLFKKAVQKYEQVLELAAIFEKEPSSSKLDFKLGPIYFSIAQSYEDDEQLEKAIDFYRKEIEFNRGNVREQVETLLKVAVVEDNLAVDPQRIEETYKRALHLSAEGESKDLSLRNKCLLKLKDFQIKYARDGLAETERILKLNRITETETETESEEENDNAYDYINISDVESESESVPILRSVTKRSGGRISSSSKFKRNEKGEWPLHVACIANNVKQVEKLLEQGHPVNVRDNSGWLPIHEACNYGFTRIAEILIEAGAWKDDPGGQYCDGVTPLHDAAAGGHFETILALIERGTSVEKLTKDGSTVLDCLRDWKERAEDLSEDEETEYVRTEKLLEERMTKTGTKRNGKRKRSSEKVETNAWLDEKDPEDQHIRLDEEEMSFLSLNESNFDPNPLLGNQFETDLDDPDVARKEYQNVMANVRKRKCIVTPSSNEPSKIIPALLNDDYVVDDWLIDDTPVTIATQSNKKSIKRLKQTKLNVRVIKNVSKKTKPENFETFSQSSEEGDVSEDPIYDYRNESSSVRERENRPHCVRVKVRNKIVLIPIIKTDSTFDWLAQETSRRYFEATGIKVTLSVRGQNGAIIDKNDRIFDLDIIANGNELESEIISCVLPSIREKYDFICKSFEFESAPHVLRLLSDADESGRLILTNRTLNISNSILCSIFKTAAHQSKIKEIEISGLILSGEPCLTLLCSLLTSLPNLLRFKLEACDISSSFIRKMEEASKKTDSDLSTDLKSIVLNYNYFNGSSTTLLTLAALFPCLEVLELEYCDLENERDFLIRNFECLKLLKVLKI